MHPFFMAERVATHRAEFQQAAATRRMRLAVRRRKPTLPARARISSTRRLGRSSPRILRAVFKAAGAAGRTIDT